MLTARTPSHQKCWVNDDVLRSDLPTWLHAAGAAGYDPVLMGRMHAIGPDQLHGYTAREVGDHSPNYPGAQRQSMGVLSGANDPTPVSLEQVGSGMCAYQTKDDDVANAAVNWLHKTGAAKLTKGQPFCLSVGFMLPHPPYVADADAFELYRNKVPAPALGPDALIGQFYEWWRQNRGLNDLSDANTDLARTAYWALVHRLDEKIGRVLGALEEIGALDDTLIVYASDHGDHLGERGLWWKHTFFEESVKVPLVMRLPGVLPAGERRDQVVNLIDLSQTMLEALDVEQLPHADGRSFWPVAIDASAPWANETFSEYCTDVVPEWTGGHAVQHRMIRSENWKLMIFNDAPPLLFNLATDPEELCNKAADPDYAEVLRILMLRVNDGWDAEDIANTMQIRRVEKNILADWARKTAPQERNVWQFEAGINRLDPPSKT
jgi:choline-sulfatase